jgi:hypothetical protein
MALVRILLVLITALVAGFQTGAAAAPYTVRLGLEKIVLDAPPGFSDTTELASPRLQDLGASLVSASNHILLFALTDADLRRFTNGDPLDAKQRYLLVATPRALERERVTTEHFAGMVAISTRELGKPPQGDLLQHLAKQPAGSLSILAELKKNAAVFSVLQGTKLISPPAGFLSAEKPPQYVLSTTTLLLVRGRALQLTAFTSLDSPQDMDWLTSTTERWISELLRLNGS